MLCGFDTGDLTECYSTGSMASISSAIKRTGDYAVRVYYYNVAWGAQGLALYHGSSSSTYRASFYVYFGALPASHATFCMIGALGAPKALFAIRSDGKVTAEADGGTEVVGTSVLTAATWYRIDIKYVKGTGSNASAAIRVNLNLEATSSDGTSTVDCGYIGLDASDDSATPPANYIYFDDILGATDATYPEWEYAVNYLRPNAAGDETNWTGTYEDINDVPVNDSTYRYDGDVATTFLDNISTMTVGTIRETGAQMRAKRGSGGGSSHYLRYKKSGGTAVDVAFTLTTSPALYRAIDLGSNGPTTQTELDGFMIGASRTGGGQEMFVYEEYFLLAHTTTVSHIKKFIGVQQAQLKKVIGVTNATMKKLMGEPNV
jgi:hypothetical protein